MKFLFVHHSFPGQFGMLLRHLIAQGVHQLVFLTHASQVQAAPPGVTVVRYTAAPTSFRTHKDARPFDEAMRRAQAVAEVASGLRAAGFVPDVIIGHEGWGDTLNLRDVWPGVRQIGFREYFYHEHGTDVGFDPEFPVSSAQLPGVRARNAVATLALLQGHAGVSPTGWQRSLYPGWAQPGIHLVEDAVDLDTSRPDPGARHRGFTLPGVSIPAGAEVVTFVASSLEPYRGLHTMFRTLPTLMARPGLHVLVLGEAIGTYGPPPPQGQRWWDIFRAETARGIDPARLHWPGRVFHPDCTRVLQRSDVHLYLSYPFIVSWSLREALACGCAVVAADTEPVREFIHAGRTGQLVPPLDPGAVSDAVTALLDQPGMREVLGRGARQWAEAHFQPERHLAGWEALLAAPPHG